MRISSLALVLHYSISWNSKFNDGFKFRCFEIPSKQRIERPSHIFFTLCFASACDLKPPKHKKKNKTNEQTNPTGNWFCSCRTVQGTNAFIQLKPAVSWTLPRMFGLQVQHVTSYMSLSDWKVSTRLYILTRESSL